MTTRPKIALALLLALVLGAGAFALLHHPDGSGPLRLYGNVDIRDVALGFRVPGRVQKVLVDEGDSVEPGQLLAQLDPLPAQRELAEAQANVAALRARAQLMSAGNRPEDIAQAAAQLQEREATLDNARHLFEREQALAGTGASTQERLEQALAARDEAQARVEAARNNLAAFRRGFRVEEVAEAQANLHRAEALLAQAALRLEDTRLLASSRGVVITRAIEPGAMVATNSPVLTLSLVQPVWVRVYVRETDLALARSGTVVRVSTDSLPGRTFAGRVGFVSPTAEFTPKSVETPDLRTDLVYRLRVVVEDPQGELHQGMPVSVDVDRARQPG